MSVNIKSLFKRSREPVHAVQDEDSSPLLYNEEYINRKLAKPVKTCIIFGILAVSLLFIILMIVFNISTVEVNGCQIDPFKSDPSPILVYSGSNEFIYPKHGDKYLKLDSGKALDFVCPGKKIFLGQSQSNNSMLSGTCVSGSKFKIADVEVDWKNLKCSSPPSSTIRYTGNSCYNNTSKEIEVGFEIAKDRFLRSMLICFNQDLQVADYSYVELPASINQRILGTYRPQFQQGDGFYDIGTVNTLYLRTNQRATINGLLGLDAKSPKYIQNKIPTNYFLSRGHLTANMDNFYAAQQNASFFYQNAAPQWQTFNGFNWNQIEIDVRDYAEARAADLQVWTGVHGVAKLPYEVTNEPVELYLFVNQTSGRKALPVPEIYWKVVYNPIKQLGIALVGVNNPYVNSSSFKKICPDVSANLGWLHWEKDNQEKGFCYACSVETFRSVVNNMPNINITGLLL